MKSKIVRLVDYKSLPVEEIVIEGIEEKVETDVRHLIRKDKKQVSVDTIEKKDVVNLQISSDNPKYNHKNLMLSIGLYMMSPEFEDQLVGLKNGTTTDIHVKGDKITVLVKGIMRTVYPPFADAHVQAWADSDEGEAELHTTDEFRQFMFNKHLAEDKENALFSAALTLMEQVFEKSEFDLDDKELDELKELILQEAEEELEADGKTWDSLTPEDYLSYLGVENREQFLQSLSDSALEHYVQQLLACHYANVPIDSVQVDEDPPMNVYEFYKKHVESVVTIKIK